MNYNFINRGDIPTKTGFGLGIRDIAGKYSNVVGIGADITKSVGMNFFAEKYPERFISIGIAEQNCIGVSAGLALGGKLPVFATYGVFSALRTTDQIRISICYNNLHVIIGGAHAGISVGPDGATHQALEDIAVMRSLPNMVVLSPCDATQTRISCKAAAEQTRQPVYLRFGREAVPDYTDPDMPFTIGKAQIFKQGDDITFIATGHMTWEALEAARALEKEGVSARVINLHTVKPIDKEIIIKAARETAAIITVEEHQIHGGLGGAVAEVVAKEHPVRMDFVGVKDRFGESGKPEELLERYELKSHHIKKKAINLLSKTKTS